MTSVLHREPPGPPPNDDDAANPIRNCWDQGVRYLLKYDPPRLYRWLARNRRYPALIFISWDDSRTVTVPGGPDRIGDLIAKCIRAFAPFLNYYHQIESQTRFDPLFLARLGEYQTIFKRICLEASDFSCLSSCVFQLTGEEIPEILESAPDDDPARFVLTTRTIHVQRLDAVEIFAEIEAGEAPASFLALVPLMQNGERADIIQKWKTLVAGLEDRAFATNLVSMTPMFANLTKHETLWRQAVEGWNMTESSFINEFIVQGVQQGRQEGIQQGIQLGILQNQRENIARVLQNRFHVAPPKRFITRIQKQSDGDALGRLLDLASIAPTWNSFQTQANVLLRKHPAQTA